jgi:hypothetical protein
MDREAELMQAIEEARAGAAAWNANAVYNKITIDVLPAVIAEDNAAAARAIAAEVRDLMKEMRETIGTADPKMIRDTCDRARSISQMLSPELEEKVSAAIKQARSIARKIVKRVEKAGENAQQVIAECNTAAIDQARYAFLDLAPETDAPATAETMPAADLQRFADLDDSGGLEGLLFGNMDGTAAPELDDAENQEDENAAWSKAEDEIWKNTPEIDAA